MHRILTSLLFVLASLQALPALDPAAIRGYGSAGRGDAMTARPPVACDGHAAAPEVVGCPRFTVAGQPAATRARAGSDGAAGLRLLQHTAVFSLALLLLGCADQSAEPPPLAASKRLDLVGCVSRADVTAAQILKTFNGSQEARKLGGPFHLNEYTRSVRKGIAGTGNRPIAMVLYNLQKPVGFEGHPQHFSVWVYRDTGETKWFGGR